MFACAQCCGPGAPGDDVENLMVEQHGDKPIEDMATVLSIPALHSQLKPANSYTASLKKPAAATPLGVHLDLSTADAIHVIALREGNNPVSLYNMWSPQGQQIQVGDFITRVNGTSGDSRAMVKVLQSACVVELEINRPRRWSVTISKSGLAMGLELKYALQGISVVVDNIDEGGAVKEFNSFALPDEEIRKGDHILSVNGKTGKPSDLLKLLVDDDPVTLELTRALAT